MHFYGHLILFHRQILDALLWAFDTIRQANIRYAHGHSILFDRKTLDTLLWAFDTIRQAIQNYSSAFNIILHHAIRFNDIPNRHITMKTVILNLLSLLTVAAMI